MCTLAAQGLDKIPGLYSFSPNGQNGVPEYKHFVLTYYLVITMTNTARRVISVQYKGPSTPEGSWVFQGHLVWSEFKSSSFTRRIENCNYPGGRELGNGLKDSQGIDCNSVQNTSPLAPFFGLPLYWTLMPRNFAIPGWDPILTNAEDGPKSIMLQAHAVISPCAGNSFCADNFFTARGADFLNLLSYRYEPHLGVCVDIDFVGGLAWKFTPTPMHAHLMSDGYKMIPLFWFWNMVHLPAAINMDLAKLQTVPAALNGFYIFLLGQCMVSLIGLVYKTLNDCEMACAPCGPVRQKE